MFYELLRLALGNLMRARLRLGMTAAGVLVGTTAVIILVGMTIGLQQATEAGIGNSSALTELDVFPNYVASAGGQVSTDVPQLTPDAIRKFWKVRGVAAVIPMVFLQAGEMLADKYVGYAQVIGIDPALLPYLNVPVQRGTLSLQPGEAIMGLHAGDYFTDPKATEYQPIPVDLFTTPLQLRMYQYTSPTPANRKIKVKITAQLSASPNYDGALLMPIQEVLNYNEWITGQKYDPKTFHFDRVIVRSTSRETTDAVSQAIRDMGYGTGGLGDFLNQLNTMFTTMRLVLGGIGLIALLVAAFGVFNTMMMAILERTKEIGLMKAIGARDRDVLTVFFLEAGLVGFCGGVSGVALSLLLQNLINQAIQNLPKDSSGIPFLPVDPSKIGGSLIVIPVELSLFAIVLATSIGIAAGFYPALRAARMTPVFALKQE